MSAARRSLVIGGLGFIGVNLTEALIAGGDEVTVVTLSKARHRARAGRFEAKGVRVLEGDLRSRTSMETVVVGQDRVFNLAGASGAVKSMEDPVTDLQVNCGGNLVLLEALRHKNRQAKLVFVGSRLQYGKQAILPVTEKQAPEPLCVHAIHKSVVEQYLHLYATLFGLRYTVARVTNPYGTGQPEGRTAYGVVNRLIELALADQALPLYGDGQQQRDYLHVDDVVTALVALAESPASEGQAFNVGYGQGTRMCDMADAIIEIAGAGRVEHVPWPSLAEQIETGDFVADITKITTEIGWRPAISLRKGLEKTVASYRARVVS